MNAQSSSFTIQSNPDRTTDFIRERKPALISVSEKCQAAEIEETYLPTGDAASSS